MAKVSPFQGSTNNTAPGSEKVKLFSFIYPFIRKYPYALVGAIFALLLAAGALLGLGMSLSWLINNGFLLQNTHFLTYGLLGTGGIIFLIGSASYLRLLFVTWLGEKVGYGLRAQIFSNLLLQNIPYYERTAPGDLLTRLTADTSILQSLISTTLPTGIRNALIFLGGSLLLFWTSPLLAGLVLALAPIIVLPLTFFGRRVRRLSRDVQEHMGQMSTVAEEAFHAIKTIKAFGQEDVTLSHFKSALSSAMQQTMAQMRQRAALTFFIIMLVFTAIGVVLWVGSEQVIAGTLPAGDLTAFIFYAIVVAGSLNALGETFADIQRTKGAIQRLQGLLSLSAPALSKGQKLTETITHLSFDKVSFSYPSRPNILSLRHISFAAKSGTITAIVGPSGAGKSTLFSLLLRFYDPSAGTIFLNENNIKDLSLASLRAQFSLITQDIFLFSTTIYDNIHFGNLEASTADVEKAARLADAHAFIEKLPLGYDTLVGEKGMRLSGGQKQRIALARAFLKDAPILLLDEATSAVDSASELRVQKAFEQLQKGKITLVIAHRLSTVKAADHIVVLDEGTIIEEGIHHDLIHKPNSLYRSLANIQFDKDAEPS